MGELDPICNPRWKMANLIQPRTLRGFRDYPPELMMPREELLEKLSVPTWERLFHLRRAFVSGMSLEEISRHTRIDPWFLDAIRRMVEEEQTFRGRPLEAGVLGQGQVPEHG